MLWRTSGSIPAVGSSRNTSSGSWTRAQASWSRRRMPPDRSPARRLRASPSSSQSSRAPIRRRRRNMNRPYRLATKSRFSVTVRSSYSDTCWGMNPIRARVPAGSRVGSWPSTSTAPSLGRSAPVRSRMAVVLPAPLGPIMPTIEPRGISRSTSRRASTSSKVRLTPRRAAIGSLATVGSLAERAVLVVGCPDGPCWASRTWGSMDTGAVSGPDRCRRPASGPPRPCGSMSSVVAGRRRVRGEGARNCNADATPRDPARLDPGSRGPYRRAARRPPRPSGLLDVDHGPDRLAIGPLHVCERSRSATSGRWSDAAHRSDGSTVLCPHATTVGASSGPSIR